MICGGGNARVEAPPSGLILIHISDHLKPALIHVRERLEAPGFTPGSLICSASVAFRPL